MQRMLRTHQTTNTSKTHKMMDKKKIKRLKPGQLCTINKRVYRCTKAVDEKVELDTDMQVVTTCGECLTVNPNCLSQELKGACINLFGYDCYPRPIKS